MRQFGGSLRTLHKELQRLEPLQQVLLDLRAHRHPKLLRHDEWDD